MTIRYMPEKDRWAAVWTTPSVERTGEMMKNVIALFSTEHDARDFVDMRNENRRPDEIFDVAKESDLKVFDLTHNWEPPCL